KPPPVLFGAPEMADVAKRIQQYVQLRDTIKKLDDEHKKKMAPYRETLDKLNAVLLAHLHSINGDSVATEHGTVYRSEKKSASIADGTAFMDFVIANAAWDLLDRKANTLAAEEFIKSTGAPPPGVNFNSTFVAGVRRS
ncbi:MAG: hypothetical protein ACXWCQ_34885, partial [Burkholderiales bacterium]